VTAGAAPAASDQVEGAGPSAGRLTTAAVISTSAGTLPVFLVGGLAVQIGQDLGLGAAQIGLFATAFFGTSAMASTPAGLLTQRLGTYRSIALAAGLSTVALAGTAAIGRGLAVMLVLLCVAGASNALAQPSANQLLARGIPRTRQGLAFGVKQAAIPLGSLLAGAAVPTIGLTVGWRWAFGLAVVGPLAAVLLTPRHLSGGPRRGASGRPDSSPRALLAVAAATGTGTAAATMLGTFLVVGAVDAGMGEGRAGILLAVGSAIGISGRVLAGWLADLRPGDPLRTVQVMMAGGAFGFLLLAVPGAGPLLVIATAIAFGAGWGWNGLLVYAVVVANPSAPAAATGVTQTGLYLGGMAGPVLFGLVSDRFGFAAGWVLGAVLLLSGVVFAALGKRWGHEVRGGSEPSTR
jgi:predicted MFS family arabinose efflux permease